MYSGSTYASLMVRRCVVASLAFFYLCAASDQIQRNAARTTATNIDLFPWEKDQLTDELVHQIPYDAATAQLARIVAFQSNGSDVGHNFTRCKTFPGDGLWPSDTTWNDINTLINGSLIKTVPIASPCHNSRWGSKDSEACATLVSRFLQFNTHEEDPTSIMWPLFQGKTCMAKNATSSNDTCTLGSYPEYPVNVSSTAHIQVAVNVARSLNIRLVIKNTGNCYLGKSTGAGSLGVWTHNLKDVRYLSDLELDGYKDIAL